AGFPEAQQLQIKMVKQESESGDYQRGTGSFSVPHIPGFPQNNPEEPQVKIKEEVLDPSYPADTMDDTVVSFTVGETDPHTLHMKEENEAAASGTYQQSGTDPLTDKGSFTGVKIETEHMDTGDPLPTIRSEIVSFPGPDVKQEEPVAPHIKIEKEEPEYYLNTVEDTAADGGAVANETVHQGPNEISDEDREEMRRQLFEELRNMWGPVENEPCFQDDPVYTEEELQALRERENGERLRNTRWCQCGNCISLPTTEESVCCREIAKLKKRFTGGITCIIQVQEMQKSCLDAKLLDYMVRYRGKVSKEKYTEEYPQVMRKAAYRAFTIWTHRFFREKTCTAIPACVVNLVRMRFPYPPDRTVGLLGLWDYPAIDMAFDG
ncbi:hypothetical protein XELAEV_18032654mg, partial [Xenopus laevis]